MNDNSCKNLNQRYVTIVIDTDDPKWNWILKYNKIDSTIPDLTARIAELENLVGSFIDLLMQKDDMIARASCLLSEIIKLPDNAIADDSIKASIYEFLTGTSFDENTDNG